MFVEAHTVGQDDWTTLPDENGNTSQASRPRRRQLLPTAGLRLTASTRSSRTT